MRNSKPSPDLKVIAALPWWEIAGDAYKLFEWKVVVEKEGPTWTARTVLAHMPEISVVSVHGYATPEEACEDLVAVFIKTTAKESP